MYRFCFIILFPFFLLACQNKSTRNVPSKVEPEDSEQDHTELRVIKTSSGKEFHIFVDHSMGSSIKQVRIETRHFPNRNETYNFGAIDPIKDIWITDLDSNGYEELIFTTQGAGSGSYGKIYGFASNKDKSATPIYVRPLKTLEKLHPDIVHSYRGHDRIALSEKHKIIRTFPLYGKDDPNSKPSGGSVEIEYSLIAGEAGWILDPNQISTHKSPNPQPHKHPQLEY